MTTPTIYNTAGTFSFTAPTTGQALVRCVGSGLGGDAGAGLSSGGKGGHGAAAASKVLSLISGHVYTVVVPAGGTGGVWSGGAGGNGGDATFSDGGTVLVKAKGATTAGPGLSSGCIGDTLYSGGTGQAPSGYDGGAGAAAGGPGGGAGGVAGTSGTGAGGAGGAPGGGGGGGYQATGSNGGVGGLGLVSIDYNVTPPQTGHVTTSYSTPGTYTWTAPGNGAVTMAGYGAGGGGHDGDGINGGMGGAEGGYYAAANITVTKGETFTITFGAAGVHGSTATNGSDMTITRNSTSTVVLKAVGGHASTTTTGANGGDRTSSCVGTTINRGFAGLDRSSTTTYQSGAGGNGALPNGGAGGTSSNSTPPGNGTAPGGGGSGGNGWTNFTAGGNGGGALAQIAYYLSYGTVIATDGVSQLFLFGIDQVASDGSIAPLTPTLLEGDLTTEQSLAVCSTDLSITARTPPSWVPAGYTSLFNVDYGTFNFKSTNTTNIRAALAGAKTSTAQIVVVGDSVSEGWTYLNSAPPYNATADWTHAYPLMARDYICDTLGIGVGGSGFVRTHSVNSYVDTRWAETNCTSSTHYITLTNGPAVFSSDQPGDTVAVVVLDRGSVSVAIDSGPAVSYTGSGSGNPKRIVITGLANTTHTVGISGTGGASIAVCGVDCYTSTGLRIHNVSQGGSSAAGATGQANWSDSSGGVSGNMLPLYSDQTHCFSRDADLLMINLGGNDLAAGESPATIRAGIEAIVTAMKGSSTDVLIVMEGEGSTTFGVTTAQYVAWFTACYQMVLDHDWTLVDSEFITGGYSQAKAQGYVTDDYGHFNVAGAKVFGTAVGIAMLQPV